MLKMYSLLPRFGVGLVFLVGLLPTSRTEPHPPFVCCAVQPGLGGGAQRTEVRTRDWRGSRWHCCQPVHRKHTPQGCLSEGPGIRVGLDGRPQEQGWQVVVLAGGLCVPSPDALSLSAVLCWGLGLEGKCPTLHRTASEVHRPTNRSQPFRAIGAMTGGAAGALGALRRGRGDCP